VNTFASATVHWSTRLRTSQLIVLLIVAYPFGSRQRVSKRIVTARTSISEID
jgi:hypothetical protein